MPKKAVDQDNLYSGKGSNQLSFFENIFTKVKTEKVQMTHLPRENVKGIKVNGNTYIHVVY